MTTPNEIREWLNEGLKFKATHVLIVCDTYDYENYPVYVLPGQDVRKVAEAHNDPSMTRLMEVYSLTGVHPIEVQLRQARSFNYD
jgi:hypothetical protein